MGNAAVGGDFPTVAAGFGRCVLLSTVFGDYFGDAGCTSIMVSLGVAAARAANPEFAFS